MRRAAGEPPFSFLCVSIALDAQQAGHLHCLKIHLPGAR
jgi:hypothetical protein